MSYTAMGIVRGCALTDGTLVDVLEALAYSLNDQTKKCCPSTARIAKIARVSERFVRRSLRTLEDRGYISTVQKAGGVRFFILHLDRLPQDAEEEGATNVTPLTIVTPITNVTPLQIVRGTPEQLLPPPHNNCAGDPLTIVTPNREVNREVNREREQVLLRPTFAADAAPGPLAAPACTSGPDGFEDSLYAEADLWAEEHDAEGAPDDVPPADYLPAPAPAPEEVEAAPQYVPPKAKYPPCPYEKLVALYHETCPMLPRVMVITPARKRCIGARWKEVCAEDDIRTQAEGLEGMKTFFEIVAKSRFLTGRCDPGFGRTRIFVADLDWLMKPTNFIKVCEGKYENAPA